MRVAGSLAALRQGHGDLWDSGRVPSSTSVGVVYGGTPLRSRQRCFWAVRVWNRQGVASEWSDPACWTMGLLEPDDWQGHWIGHVATAGAGDAPAPLLRHAFVIDTAIQRAIVYVAGVGFHELAINGSRVGQHVLDPACTDYDKRVLYVTHDVTGMLRVGANAVGAELGRGFFGLETSSAWNWDKAPWHAAPRLLLQIEVTFIDGTQSIVATNADWRAIDGPTRSDSIYAGESYDARADQAGWTKPGFDDANWAAATVMAAPTGRLVAQSIEPIQVMETFAAHAISEPRDGIHVFDMGRTLGGWARLRVTGASGTRITLKYGQQLRPDGTVNLDQGYVHGGRFQTDEYILRGDGEETWQPRFSHKSFRYVEVSGLPATPTAATLQGQEVRSSLRHAGTFACSSDLYNRIHAMAVRSLGHHLLGIPAVDVMYEKIGWTADAQLNVPSMLLNFESHRFLAKWLDDIADSQTDAGNLPLIVPSGGWSYAAQGPEWKAAYPIVMWALYQRSGDPRILAMHFEGVARYVAWEMGRLDADGLATTDLGDWLAPGGYTQPPEDSRLTATAYVYRDLCILAAAALAMGRLPAAADFQRQAVALRETFNEAFLDRDRVLYRTAKDPGYRQCSNAIALAFELVPDELRAGVAASLVADVRAHGNHLNTGALGTAVLLPVLSATGHGDIAHAIASQRSFPSWGFWLEHGADTLWETWELQQDGQGRPPSHDHYIFGSIETWFYEYLLGITTIDPGYRRVRLRPDLDGPLTWADGSIETVQGRLALRWTRQADGGIDVYIELPTNTTGELHVPKRFAPSIREGDGMLEARYDKQYPADAIYGIGAGHYAFTAR